MSASIGRPLHFSEHDCDVEALQVNDIDELDREPESEIKHYACQMARLSTISKCDIM